MTRTKARELVRQALKLLVEGLPYADVSLDLRIDFDPPLKGAEMKRFKPVAISFVEACRLSRETKAGER